MILFSFSFSKIISLILFLVILCFLIALHELGHFLSAKKFNVYCYEYSIGFGKAFYVNKKHETYFCLRVLPLGGFVKMAGEEGVNEGEELLDNNNQPIPKNRILSNLKQGPKILILAAGGLINMLIAFICFYIVICVTGMPQFYSNSFAISNDGLFYQEGISNEASIYQATVSLQETVAGELIFIKEEKEFKISNFYDLNEALTYVNPTKANQTQNLKIVYSLKGSTQKQEASFTRVSIEENGVVNFKEMLGVGMLVKDANMLSAIPDTFVYMWYYLIETFKAFGQLFVGNLSNLSGLVGIYNAVDTAATQATFADSLLNIINITGVISFSLGFFNLIPFPALDGGRIFFRLIEIVTRKKVNPNVEGTIHAVGFLLLIGLMVIVNIKDIIGLFAILM